MTALDYQYNYKKIHAFVRFYYQFAELHADKVFIRYPVTNAEGQVDYKTMTYRDIDRMSTNLACQWKELKTKEVVGLMCDHSLQYLLCVLAVLKLRVPLLCISPRNSEAAVVHLISKTNCQRIIATDKYIDEANSAVLEKQDCDTQLYPELDLEALRQEPVNAQAETVIDRSFSEADEEKLAIIMHSSGSTSFPKPLRLSNRYLIQFIQYFQIAIHSQEPKLPYNEESVMMPTLPIFHGFGFNSILNMMTVGGSAVFLPQLPPTPQELDSAIRANKATLMVTPPIVLEHMIPYLQETHNFSGMQQLKLVLFGGATLKPSSAEYLLDHQINVRACYGTTEFGPAANPSFDLKNRAWDCVTFIPTLKKYIEWEPVEEEGPDVYHMVVKAGCPLFATGIANRENGDYGTSDVFRETPPGSGFYIYVERNDDTITLQNGEKTNPVPMENTIRSEPLVKQCVVFGSKRQCVGVLVELDMEVAVQYSPAEMIQIVDRIVKVANKDAPGFSRLLPQMIRILPLNKQLPCTDKGTIIRKRAAAQYAELIDTMYEELLTGRQVAHTEVNVRSAKDVTNFIVNAAAEVLEKPVSVIAQDPSRSLFDFGLDSLLSIQLRNRLLQAFDAKVVTQNICFQYPSIQALTNALTEASKNNNVAWETLQIQETEKLLDQYLARSKQDFKTVHPVSSKPSQDQVVLLTGATGSLGSFILDKLLQQSNVRKVVCLVRGDNIGDRLQKAMVDRGLDASLLPSKVVVLPLKLRETYLGLSEKQYETLQAEVTMIQHCGWLLDFHHPLSHYDKECIQGTYELLKFANRSQESAIPFHFISSESTCGSGTASIIDEAPCPRDATVPMAMGYAQSKYIVEHLLAELRTQKQFPAYIHRLGQICGDTQRGVWNESEQFPLMMIGGAVGLGKMPALSTRIDWLPVDYAASAIVELMLSGDDAISNSNTFVFHIVHPQDRPWTNLLEAMKANGLSFKTVSPSEWLDALKADPSNPAYKLLPFFEARFTNAFDLPTLATKKTVEQASILAQAPVVDKVLLGKYLDHWQKTGFYKK